MDSASPTSAVAASTSVAVVVVTHLLQKRREDDKHWRDERLGFYKDVMRSISDLVERNKVEGADKRFADCTNPAPLYAPVQVVKALYDFRPVVRVTATSEERSQGNQLLTVLIDEIRRDLRLGGTLRVNHMEVQLWASGNPTRDRLQKGNPNG